MRTYLSIAALFATLIIVAFIGSYDFKSASLLLSGIAIGICGFIALIKVDVINTNELKGEGRKIGKTKFYDFEGEQLVQARNKKDAIKTAGLENEDKEFLPYIEIISEQRALEILAGSHGEDDDKPLGFSEARRMIDEDKSRVLTIASDQMQ